MLTKSHAVKPIYSITPFTLLDFPHITACILWFSGCNMKCLYCYNPEIVSGKGQFSYEDSLSFLKKRQTLLDGVILSGGECTSHKHFIPFLKEVKQLGYAVKIDTNGSNSALLAEIIKLKLVDYIALDFKSLPDNYKKITQSDLFDSFQKTLDILLEYKVKFEVRTTYHSDLISISDLKKMILFLEQKGYIGYYYIQNFINNTPTIGNLNYSTKLTEIENLSTKRIKAVLR
nr:anaerobic ribonucleoside-triphosphate reductase activating protein [Flavobacterium sp. H122]